MKKVPIEMIVAATPDGDIGYKNTIPWKLKGDLQRFKRLTMGNYVIIGRNTLNSLPSGLPGRNVIVVSKTLSNPRNACQREQEGMHIVERAIRPHYVGSLPEAFLDIGLFGCDGDALDKKIFIAGGARLYEEMLEFASEGLCDLTVHLTTVYKKPHTPWYDTKIANFHLLDKFEVVGHPEEVYDELHQDHDAVFDLGAPMGTRRLLSRDLSHTYTTLRNK
jgi:dihydrofolate reductase